MQNIYLRHIVLQILEQDKRGKIKIIIMKTKSNNNNNNMRIKIVS